MSGGGEVQSLEDMSSKKPSLIALPTLNSKSVFNSNFQKGNQFNFKVCNTPISGCIKALPITTARTKRYSKGGQRQLKTRAIIITQVTTLTIVQQT